MIKLEKGKTYWVATIYYSSFGIYKYDTLVTHADVKGMEDEDCFSNGEIWLGNGEFHLRNSLGDWWTEEELEKMNIGEFDKSNHHCIAETREQLIKALASCPGFNFKKIRTSINSKMKRRKNNIERLQQEYFKLIENLSTFDEIFKIAEKK